MYQVTIDGVDDIRFVAVNYDDAERIVALIVEYGKTIKSHYVKDENGETLKDARGFGVTEKVPEFSKASIQYVESEEVTV